MFNIQRLCLQSAFALFYGSQTTNIILYGINLLVFLTEVECVYCAVRSAYLIIIRVNLRFQMFRVPFLNLTWGR